VDQLPRLRLAVFGGGRLQCRLRRRPRAVDRQPERLQRARKGRDPGTGSGRVHRRRLRL